MPDPVLLALVLLVFFGLWQFIGRATGVDLNGLIREQWLAFQVYSWEKQSNGPPVLKRTYWMAAEFKRDHVRLGRIGYKITDQSSPQRGSQELLLGPRSSCYRRRLPAFYVTDQRDRHRSARGRVRDGCPPFRQDGRVQGGWRAFTDGLAALEVQALGRRRAGAGRGRPPAGEAAPDRGGAREGRRRVPARRGDGAGRGARRRRSRPQRRGHVAEDGPDHGSGAVHDGGEKFRAPNRLRRGAGGGQPCLPAAR